MDPIDAVVHLVEAAGVIGALWYSHKASRRDDIKDLAVQLVALPEVKEKIEEVAVKAVGPAIEKAAAETLERAKESAETIATDRIHLYINRDEFMPREVQEGSNREVFRRLATLEQKFDQLNQMLTTNAAQLAELPQKVINGVMLEIRRRSE